MPAVYRIVRDDVPTDYDFQSSRARGRAVADSASDLEIALWAGVSVYDTDERARKKARGLPQLGSHIAHLELPDGPAIPVARTTRSPGHHTIWGSRADMGGGVVAVFRV